MNYEIIGYTASVLIAISLMMTSIIKLRSINFIGALLFAIYGYLIGSYPVGILNGIIAILNIYYLFKLKTSNEIFKIKTYNTIDNELIKTFIEFYEKDIDKYFPNFLTKIDKKELFSIVVFRNNIPANILIGTKNSNTLNLIIDYVIPEYRDFKLAKYLFTVKKSLLLENNILNIKISTNNQQHQRYLKALNFKELEQNNFKLIL